MTTTRIPATEITGAYGAIVKSAVRRMVGEVPDSVGVMWHNPIVFKDLMSIGRKSEKWDALDADLGSFARMAAAAEVGCSFCLDFDYFMAHNRGLDEERAREVPRWRESSVFSPLERQVMEYAEAMCQTPPAVTDELLELAAKVSLMNATARMNIALGIRSDHYADACGLPPLATRSTVAEAA